MRKYHNTLNFKTGLKIYMKKLNTKYWNLFALVESQKIKHCIKIEIKNKIASNTNNLTKLHAHTKSHC